MNELIKITETNGKKAVSARELYSFLSIDDGSHFARWATRNIEPMFTESIDYQILRPKGENGGYTCFKRNISIINK
jgi:phage anti-repressor protein